MLLRFSGLFVLSVACGQDDSFDPRKIPPGERIAYVNRIADRAGAENARELYETAATAFKRSWEFPPQEARAEVRQAYLRVFDNEWPLTVAARWTDEEARVLHEWLRANQRALEVLQAATERATYFQPLASPNNRLYDIAPLENLSLLRQYFKLLLLRANDAALDGDW